MTTLVTVMVSPGAYHNVNVQFSNSEGKSVGMVDTLVPGQEKEFVLHDSQQILLKEGDRVEKTG